MTYSISLLSRHPDAPASSLWQRLNWVMTKQATAVFVASNSSDRIQWEFYRGVAQIRP